MMRILGPDGNPIGGGSNDVSVTPEVRQAVEQAQALAAQGEVGGALQQVVIAFQTDVTSDLVLDTTCDLLAAMAQQRGDTERIEYQLFDQLRNNRDNAAAYYAVGARFFRLQQHVIARPFYAKAYEMLDPTEKSEVAQLTWQEYALVLMELGGYQECVEILHQFNERFGGLSAALILKMAECYALLRQTGEADQLFGVVTEEAIQMDPNAAQLSDYRDEIGDMIARVHDFDEQAEPLGLRQWHYIQTRGILLETNPDENFPGERFVFFTPSEEDIAYIVALTAAMLDHKGYAPNKLLYIGASSEVLARTFAQWWEIDEANIREYRRGDNTESEDELALLVLAHSYDLMESPDQETFVDPFAARAGLITFALDIHWTDAQPLTPDIGGFLTQLCHLPWEATVTQEGEQVTVTQITEAPDATAISARMGGQFPEEAEIEKFAIETLELYEGCTDLILDHRDGSLTRRPVVTHTPIPSPRLGF